MLARKNIDFTFFTKRLSSNKEKWLENFRLPSWVCHCEGAQATVAIHKWLKNQVHGLLRFTRND